ncbi:MAG: GNAT family N-acetyltransferase [Chloroflexota bacterium]|nr:GNAT family N-acetyltransferase [Chloroflexota bacterium]
MTRMPPLETARLQVRPFLMADLDALHRIVDIELSEADVGTEGAQSLGERRAWLEWAVLNYDQLAKMYQPPYGDRAIVLKQTGQLIGAIGYVPCMMPFGQLPALAVGLDEATQRLSTCELGLYYALAPAHQRQGYTSEAAAAMIEYAFQNLGLRRVVATTTYDNQASMGVMRKLGMRVERNPFPDPPWMQVVGFIEHQPNA